MATPNTSAARSSNAASANPSAATTRSNQSPQEKQAARAAKKSESFKKLATKRVNKALTALRQISQLSNRNTYAYDDSQIAKIFTALDGEIANARKRFDSTAKPDGFTL